MKSFNANLLKHLSRKKNGEKGFTLIELLVVIIIIGILAAIALPAFLNQASKARQSEAKQALGAANRGQQAYRLENPNFALSVDQLALGLKTNTKNFNYGNSSDFKTTPTTIGAFMKTDGSALDTATAKTFAGLAAVPIDATAVRSYAGGTGTSSDNAGNATTVTILCESNKPIEQGGTAPELKYTAQSGTTPAKLECKDATLEL